MKRLAGILGCLMALSAFGTEFFVAPHGSNSNKGTSPEQPYKTLKRAADVMKPGDTMTLLPGEYHQSLEWNFDGGDAVTTIRAAIPGSVVLRGDVDAPEFTPSSLSPRVWQCHFPQLPQAVNERDTLLIYARMPSIAELEFTPASWFYDETTKLLYVHTGDSAPPARHYLTVSVLPRHGIMIQGSSQVRNIAIEGLTLTGFNAGSPGGQPGHNAKWGIYLTSPRNCTVRNVTTFLNGSGIGFSRGSSDSAIENCRSYANHSPFFGSGGNIIVLTPSEKTAIRNCIAFDSPLSGIRFYGGDPAQHCIFEDNIAFDNGYGDLWMKYPSDTTTARRCVAGQALYARLIENSLFDYGDTGYFGAARNSIIRPREKDFDEIREFADPWNHDYRPQANSPYRDRAPALFSDAVYYIKDGGNNQQDGNSVKTAWASLDGKLKDGATFYLLPGSRQSGLTLSNLKNVTIRGRGPFPVKLNGGITLENCENITLERLEFTALNVTGSRQIAVNQCAVAEATALNRTADYRLTHCVLNGVRLDGSNGGVIAANIFAAGSIATNASSCWSDYNSYTQNVPKAEPHSFAASPEFGKQMTLQDSDRFDGRNIDGMPVGPYRRQPWGAPLQLDGPELLSSTATTANIEFAANYPVAGTISYGKTADCKEKYPFRPQSPFQTLSLSGLEPDSDYYYFIKAAASAPQHFSNRELAAGLTNPERTVQTEVRSFRTPAQDAAPRTYYVSENGSNTAPGTKSEPWRTISHAVTVATAGDTVLVHGGTYRESVRLRATGDAGRPLKIAAVPGEKPWLDGNVRQLNFAFSALNKNDIELDGFYFREIRQSEGLGTAGIILVNSNHITVNRCFYDGRSQGYTPYFIRAVNCADLTLSNSFSTRAFHGMSFTSCPNLLIRNCVFYINQINSCSINNKPGEKATLRNNIWVDNTLQKVSNPLINLTDAAVLEESDNCFLLRVPENERTIFGYNRFNGRNLPASDKGEVLDRQWRRQGRFGSEMATYDDFLKRAGRKGSAIFIDPGFKALPNFIRFKSLADWEQNYAKHSAAHNQEEYHRRNDNYLPLDFSDFQATAPELLRRNIGLEPALFR
jgi:hypothetical protein